MSKNIVKGLVFNILGIMWVITFMFIVAWFLTWSMTVADVFVDNFLLFVRISIFMGVVITWMES